MKLKSDLRRLFEFGAFCGGIVITAVIACVVFLVMLSTVLRWLLDK